MPEHDGSGARRAAGTQAHDLAWAGLSKRDSGAPDKAGIAAVLHQCRAALRLPAAGFEVEEYLDRRSDLFSRARHIEMNVAMLGKPVALAAQFLQFLRAQGVTQQFIGIARRVEAGADMGLQHPRTDAGLP